MYYTSIIEKGPQSGSFIERVSLLCPLFGVSIIGCSAVCSLTVAEVNQYLDDLALSNTKKDRPGVKKALQLLLRNTSGLEQKWLIRIILKARLM